LDIQIQLGKEPEYKHDFVAHRAYIVGMQIQIRKGPEHKHSFIAHRAYNVVMLSMSSPLTHLAKCEKE